MNNNKDISQNMKDNQHKLNKKPSDKAWDKLEGQLNDFQPKAKRRKLIAKWSIAASILAIVGIGALVSNNLKTDNNQTAMVANKEMTFEVLSHVEISKSKKAVEESYRSAQKDVKIIEGAIAKKLVPSPAIVKVAEVVNMPDVPVETVPTVATSSTIIKNETSTIQSKTDIALNVESDAIAMKDDVLSSASGKNDIQAEVSSTKEMEMEKGIDKKAIATKTNKKTETKKSTPTPTKKAKSSYLMSSSLNEFKWIMGDWREIAGGNSSWNLAGDNLLKNEDLKISLVGDKVYLDAPFEDFEGRYTLVSKANSQFVFVRNGVIITIKKNGKGFDVVLNDHGFEQVTMRSYMK